uniref:Uncharacterized protein n=1 Tax=Caenorhabditis japonica TaxID=281687 RepID=A0A8R1DN86_CAEJA
MAQDENHPLLIVGCITLSLGTTLIVIKAVFNLITELAGPLETGPARRATAKDARNQEEAVPMKSCELRRAKSLPPLRLSQQASLPAPSVTTITHIVRSVTNFDY